MARPTTVKGFALLAAVALTAGCFSEPDDATVAPEGVQGGQGGGGGSVRNAAPTVSAWTASPSLVENVGGDVVVFSATIRDDNGERNIAQLSVSAMGPSSVASSSRTVTGGEANSESEPAQFGEDGWKVWSGSTRNDGELLAKYRFTVPFAWATGAYVWSLTATDAAGEPASANVTVTVVLYSEITVAAAPVLSNGSVAVGASFGGWSAVPGAQNVASTNWLMLTNTGLSPTASAVIDFSPAAFMGVSDPEFSIPIDGNVQFAWFEDVTPASTSPAEGGGLAWGAASPSGSATVSFTGLGNVVYVQYRIVALPAVLPAQEYSASFTVAEV